MSDDGTFNVVPEDVKKSSALIDELGKYAWGILSRFKNATADTSWAGDDPNGHKILANFTKNRNSSTDSLSSLAEALERTGEATLMNLARTTDTQGGILDAINEQSGEYEGGSGRRG